MIPAMIIIPLLVAAWGWHKLRQRGLNRCVIPYLLQSRRRRCAGAGEEVHLLLCIADHFEPQWGKASPACAQERVSNWVERYPALFGGFRDSDGRPPRHTFFFPIDQYVAQHVESLAGLCRQGFGEVEIHLHHDQDNAENLRRTFEQYKLLLANRHGLLGRRSNGEIAFGFVHGDWALDNSRADGRCCGVNNELDVLRQVGCFADFTLPSVPSSTQTRKINAIYYAKDDPLRPKSHDWGVDVGMNDAAPSDSLMLIQGPLLLDARRRRIENGCLQASQPPDMHRLELWLKANVHVPSRPDWRFVKLHTHGAPQANQEILLGQSMLEFHRGLQKRADADRKFHFHYVTAREMYNLAKAAEAKYVGTVADALDYELVSNIFNRPIALAV
jgi:hypothetical protein